MKVKTQGTIWTALLTALLVIGQWLDDTYFHTGVREWLPPILNSAQTILGVVGLALGLAYTIFMELQDQKLHDFGQADVPGTRSVNSADKPGDPLWKRIL